MKMPPELGGVHQTVNRHSGIMNCTPCLSLWERWLSEAKTERESQWAAPSQSPAVTALSKLSLIHIYLSVKCDGVQAMECGGDGVIVATPTGSTAYSFSAGGPIVEPEANNIIITPICAHEVGSRCIVASDRRVVTVEMVRNARRNAYVSVDGGRAFRLNLGDVVTIQKSHLETKLVRLKERSFYDVVNAKFKKV